MANKLILQGKIVTGVIERAFIVNGHRVGYVFDMLPDHRLRLAAWRRHYNRDKTAFSFLAGAFEQAKQAITKPAQYCFIDELGLIEAEGKGLWPALEAVIRLQTAKNLVVAVRPDLPGLFMERINGLLEGI